MLVPFGKDRFSGTSNVLREKVILTALFQPDCSLLLICSFCFLFNPHRVGWQKAQLSNCEYTASTQLASKGNDFNPQVPISSGKRIYAELPLRLQLQCSQYYHPSTSPASLQSEYLRWKNKQQIFLS